MQQDACHAVMKVSSRSAVQNAPPFIERYAASNSCSCLQDAEDTGRCASCEIPGCDKCAENGACAQCGSGFQLLAGNCSLAAMSESVGALRTRSIVQSIFSLSTLFTDRPWEVSGGRRCFGR